MLCFNPSDSYDNNENGMLNENDLNDVNISKNDELRMIYIRNFVDKIEKDFQRKDVVTKQIQ
jgi:hypothetical protein